MKISKKEGENYINSFPKLKNLINECVCCHEKGYDPIKFAIFSESCETFAPYCIKKYFNPLPLNQDGLCEQCERVLKNRRN